MARSLTHKEYDVDKEALKQLVDALFAEAEAKYGKNMWLNLALHMANGLLDSVIDQYLANVANAKK